MNGGLFLVRPYKSQPARRAAAAACTAPHRTAARPCTPPMATPAHLRMAAVIRTLRDGRPCLPPPPMPPCHIGAELPLAVALSAAASTSCMLAPPSNLTSMHLCMAAWSTALTGLHLYYTEHAWLLGALILGTTASTVVAEVVGAVIRAARSRASRRRIREGEGEDREPPQSRRRVDASAQVRERKRKRKHGRARRARGV